MGSAQKKKHFLKEKKNQKGEQQFLLYMYSIRNRYCIIENVEMSPCEKVFPG